MKNLKALLRLELAYIKTYWPYLFLFLGIPLIFALTSQSGAIYVFNVILVASLALATFSFEFTDKSNLNVLYGTLPTNRKSIVTARYLFNILQVIVVTVIGIVVGIVIDLAFNQSINFGAIFQNMAFALGIFLVLVGFLMPFLFKLGWQKGRIMFWVAIAVMVLVMNAGGLLNSVGVENSFNIFELAFRNLTLSISIVIGIGAVAYGASFILSRRIYLKKDF